MIDQKMVATVVALIEGQNWGGEPLTSRERNVIELAAACAYPFGIKAAADYVDGNWSDAHTMAAHLRTVADGDKPMYAD